MFTNGSTAIELREPTAAGGVGFGATSGTGVSSACGCLFSANLSRANNPTATASTPVIRNSSLRPVRRGVDASGGTSMLRFNPCGVSSKAQANTSARGNPRTTSVTTTLRIHAGASNSGNTSAATWTTTQPTTP